MGLFDSLGGILNNLERQGGSSPNGGGLAELCGQLFQQAGGLEGIVAKLNEAGLGREVSSWIGTDSNLPISADQIRAALGNEEVQKLAASFGVPVEQLSEILAQHLPATVDQASPEGTLKV
jgi:uncharacterized protein YidB (DUF937 family)